MPADQLGLHYSSAIDHALLALCSIVEENFDDVLVPVRRGLGQEVVLVQEGRTVLDGVEGFEDLCHGKRVLK